MQIINITNKEQLNNFVGRQEHSQFLQSWEWGEFQKKVTGNVLRLGIQKNGQLIATATTIKKLLPMGKSYFYCPRGPVIKLEVITATATPRQRRGSAKAGPWAGSRKVGRSKKLEVNRLLFDKISELAKSEKVMFLRFEPEFSITNSQFLVSKTIDVQPSKTLILNLSKLEEELLKDMHQKTRYNIRLAEKKGVKIIEAGINQFEKFWQLTGETSQRDKFRLHSRNYYHKMLEIDKNFIKLFLAEYNNKIIAANIVSFFGDTVTYLHGASSNEYRNIMAPYLLQWYCIKSAKEQGYNYYDFSGVDENKWPGLTRFKKGFGGKVVVYPGTFDLIFNKRWYGIYKLMRRLRRKF